jgi:hypothetical protein
MGMKTFTAGGVSCYAYVDQTDGRFNAAASMSFHRWATFTFFGIWLKERPDAYDAVNVFPKRGITLSFIDPIGLRLDVVVGPVSFYTLIGNVK